MRHLHKLATSCLTLWRAVQTFHKLYYSIVHG
jgi:hypothetical protein